MNQEDKELLLRDLCGRLPYGVKCIVKSDGYIGVISSIESQYGVVTFDDGRQEEICDIKPYLFPLSSMTEEQKNELRKIIYVETEIICNQLKTNNYGIEDGKYHFNSILQVDWLNKNHFDYRGIIEKGLAIDATGLNIYKEDEK